MPRIRWNRTRAGTEYARIEPDPMDLIKPRIHNGLHRVGALVAMLAILVVEAAPRLRL